MDTMFVKGNSFILSRGVFQLKISLTTKQKHEKMIQHIIKWQNMVLWPTFGALHGPSCCILCLNAV